MAYSTVAVKMSLSRRRIADDIYVVRFDSQYALASTFLRIQEHYESSHFRGRVFSLEEFMDWYAAKFGAFSYYEDWSGFNVPSIAFEPFYSGRFNPLLRKEQQLLRLFEKAKAPFYVIGLYQDDDLTHELAHALFYLRPAYRHAIRTAMRGYNTAAIARHLASVGYHRRVVEDEVHAYLVSGDSAAGLSLTRLAPLRRALRAIYRLHARELRIPT
jgi:hypothetical protein